MIIDGVSNFQKMLPLSFMWPVIHFVERFMCLILLLVSGEALYFGFLCFLPSCLGKDTLSIFRWQEGILMMDSWVCCLWYSFCHCDPVLECLFCSEVEFYIWWGLQLHKGDNATKEKSASCCLWLPSFEMCTFLTLAWLVLEFCFWLKVLVWLFY